MADETVVTETVEAESVQDSGNLPSSITSNDIDSTKWDIPDSMKDSFKEGKLLDRFASIEELVAGYKDMSAKHANYVRDTKDGIKADEAVIEEQRVTQETTDANTLTMGHLVSEMLENGMVVSEEMQTKLDDAKLDVRDLKLNAIDSQASINKAYESVGGKEEYEAMATWAKETLPEDVRLDFDKNLIGASADIYIQGLHAKYKMSGNATEQVETTDRISGTAVSVGTVRGYSSKAEMLADVNYINKNGHKDIAAVTAHRARMNKTPDSVVYGTA